MLKWINIQVCVVRKFKNKYNFFMKYLLIECRTALGLAKSMAERERYDTDVYTKRIEMIDKALRKLAVVGRSEQLPCPKCGDYGTIDNQDGTVSTCPCHY